MSEQLLPVETLERLRRREGVDVRPTLVRVLTDLFIQKAHHAPEEIRRYEELTLQLLDVVDADTRAVVARKLADEPRAPHTIIARLLSDEFLVSSPILSGFAGVPRDMLMSIALDGGAAEARAVAARADMDPELTRTLAYHPDELVLETLVGNAAAIPADGALESLVERARTSPALAAAILRRLDFDAAALAPLYLMASPEGRKAIRAAIGVRFGRLGRRAPAALDPADAESIALAIEVGNGELMGQALGAALDLKPEDASWLTAEPSGEGFVLALRAAGAGNDAISRALLTCQPDIAKSVPRFFELVEIAEATPRAVASEILSAIVGAETRAATAARHEPMLDPSGVMERAGSARSAQRPRRAVARPSEINRGRG